ncbi:hypothetical protein BaRGS_00015615, partial [Batillaria attramentaria]
GSAVLFPAGFPGSLVSFGSIPDPSQIDSQPVRRESCKRFMQAPSQKRFFTSSGTAAAISVGSGRTIYGASGYFVRDGRSHAVKADPCATSLSVRDRKALSALSTIVTGWVDTVQSAREARGKVLYGEPLMVRKISLITVRRANASRVNHEA